MENTNDIITQVPVSCNKDCGGGCPLTAFIKNGKLIKISNSKHKSEYMTGCARGFKFGEVVYDSKRLTVPLIRNGERGDGKFKEVSWDEALDYTAAKLLEIKKEYGTDSILNLEGGGACRGALHNTALLPMRFLRLFGGCTETDGSFSSQATTFATPYVFGTENCGLDFATLKFSNLIILWGANISDVRFGGESENYILEQKKRGIHIIVIDPRKSRTVKKLATEWIQIYPGTDTVLMAAVLFVLIEKNLIEHDFINKYSIGFWELKKYINGEIDNIPKSPYWASKICGVSEQTIINLALKYSESKPAALMPGLSIQRTIGGEDTLGMAAALQLATGNIGIKGGSSGGLVWSRLPSPRYETVPIPPSLTNKSVPVYRWADAVIGGKQAGYPTDIKAIYNVGENFLSQGSEINKNIEAFKKVSFSICHDTFMTPTAKYCDVIFPVTTWIEREDIIDSGVNYLFYSHKAIEPVNGVKNDYDIFSELAQRLGFKQEYTENRSNDEWLEYIVEHSEIDDFEKFKKTGIYDAGNHQRYAFKDFIDDPVSNPLKTPSGLIEISSKLYTAETGFPPIPQCRFLEISEKYPIRLVTPHSKFFINSSNSNISWFRKQEEQILLMNSKDSNDRKIEQGTVVRLYNEIGSIVIKVSVSNDIMPGVACLPQGVWPEFNKNNDEINGSANAVTSTVPTEPSKGARTHSINIEIERFEDC